MSTFEMGPLSGLIAAGAVPPHRFLKGVAGGKVGRTNVGDPVIAISGAALTQDGAAADCYGVHSKGPQLVEVGAPLQALARVAPDAEGKAAPDNAGPFAVLEPYAVGDVAEVYPVKARSNGGGVAYPQAVRLDYLILVVRDDGNENSNVGDRYVHLGVRYYPADRVNHYVSQRVSEAGHSSGTLIDTSAIAAAQNKAFYVEHEANLDVPAWSYVKPYLTEGNTDDIMAVVTMVFSRTA